MCYEDDNYKLAETSQTCARQNAEVSRRPDGICPENRNDATVHNTIGDLFFCDACEEFRRPSMKTTRKTSKASRKQINRPENPPVVGASGMKISVQSDGSMYSAEKCDVICSYCYETVASSDHQQSFKWYLSSTLYWT